MRCNLYLERDDALFLLGKHGKRRLKTVRLHWNWMLPWKGNNRTLSGQGPSLNVFPCRSLWTQLWWPCHSVCGLMTSYNGIGAGQKSIECHRFYEFYGQVGKASKSFQSMLLSRFFFTDLNVGKGKGSGRSRHGMLRRRGTPWRILAETTTGSPSPCQVCRVPI